MKYNRLTLTRALLIAKSYQFLFQHYFKTWTPAASADIFHHLNDKQATRSYSNKQNYC